MKIRVAGYPTDGHLVVSLDAQVTEDALVTLWNPAVARPTGVALAFLDVTEDSHGVAHPAARRGDALGADAYAGDFVALAEAVEWLNGATATADSPNTLTYLGALGAHAPHIPIGQRFVIDEEVRVGRSKSCPINLRHGAHSDQNLAARIHAMLKPAAEGVHVVDAQSTNGTFVDGEKKAEFVATPGQEIAFAGCFRFRVG